MVYSTPENGGNAFTKFGPNYNVKIGSKSLYASGSNSHPKVGNDGDVRVGDGLDWHIHYYGQIKLSKQ